MIRPHAQILHERERRLIVDGLDAAIASLDRFERPSRPRRRWSAQGRIASQAMARSMLRSRGGMLETRFVGSADGLRMEILGADSGTASPLLTIRERTPLDRNPTFCDAEEIEAAMRRWHRIVRDSVVLDVDDHKEAAVLVGAMAVAAGADAATVDGLGVRLPSRYERGFHMATEDDMARNGVAAYRPVEDVLNGDGRERILASHATSAITSQWWNYGSVKAQQRVMFDLSGVMNVVMRPPGPVEIMRRLAA